MATPKTAMRLFQVAVPEGTRCARLPNGTGFASNDCFRCERLTVCHRIGRVAYRCALFDLPLKHSRTGGNNAVRKHRKCRAMALATEEESDGLHHS